MVRHIVMWTFREFYYGAQIDEIKNDLKKERNYLLVQTWRKQKCIFRSSLKVW